MSDELLQWEDLLGFSTCIGRIKSKYILCTGRT